MFNREPPAQKLSKQGSTPNFFALAPHAPTSYYEDRSIRTSPNAFSPIQIYRVYPAPNHFSRSLPKVSRFIHCSKMGPAIFLPIFTSRDRVWRDSPPEGDFFHELGMCVGCFFLGCSKRRLEKTPTLIQLHFWGCFWLHCNFFGVLMETHNYRMAVSTSLSNACGRGIGIMCCNGLAR